MKFVKDEVRHNCHDCNAKVGEHHLSGCDTERCPKCGGQLIGCYCFRIGDKGFDDKEFEKYEQEKWSGIMFEDEKLYAEQNNMFVYFKNGWIKCDATHPEATQDINNAIMKMPKFTPKYKKISTMSLDVYLNRKRYISYDEGKTYTEDYENVYEANITHNLNTMAKEAGIYNYLWRPDEIKIIKAKELIESLRQGLHNLKREPERYKKFNPENEWGSYDVLVNFVENYLNACYEYPDAIIEVSR